MREQVGETVQVVYGGFWVPINIMRTQPGQMVRFDVGGPVFIVEADACTAIRAMGEEDFAKWMQPVDSRTQ